MKNKSGAPVVIMRKQKKTRWWLHAITFAATGGMSAPLNAAVAARNASYNRDTRKLAEASAPADAEGVTTADTPAMSTEDMFYELAIRAGKTPERARRQARALARAHKK